MMLAEAGIVKEGGGVDSCCGTLPIIAPYCVSFYYFLPTHILIMPRTELRPCVSFPNNVRVR